MCLHCGGPDGRDALFVMRAHDGKILERRTIACRPCQRLFADLARHAVPPPGPALQAHVELDGVDWVPVDQAPPGLELE